MSVYIRRYAKYLNEKAHSYRLMGYDFCKIKRGLVLFLDEGVDLQN
jgi:phosphatidylinositol-binding clathrin assembly protein